MSRLTPFLQEQSCDPDLTQLLDLITTSCRSIRDQLQQGALAGILGSAERENIQGETQKKLDVIANNRLKADLIASPLVRGVASEEEDYPVAGQPEGRFLVTFDPLDGSSNIDVNVSVGTIFSVLEAPAGSRGDEESAFLQPGRRQLAAGYVLYGPSCLLALTTGQGVQLFTLGDDGDFHLSREKVRIPATTQEFAINMSNRRFWEAPVREYIDELLAGEEGPRGKRYNMRWVASMVADVHRILVRGGVFLYPWDNRDPRKAGKLRLMYEGNPMSLLVEQAGGASSNCRQSILDIQPQQIHQRVAVALGSAEEVETLVRYHQQAQGSS